MERDRRAKLTDKMQILLYNTKHTHTHTCFQNIVSSVSRVIIHTSHTHRHTLSPFISLSRLYVCVMERGWGVSSFSRCVFARMGGWVTEKEGEAKPSQSFLTEIP
jgi:hypothetical protein